MNTCSGPYFFKTNTRNNRHNLRCVCFRALICQSNIRTTTVFFVKTTSEKLYFVNTTSEQQQFSFFHVKTTSEQNYIMSKQHPKKLVCCQTNIRTNYQITYEPIFLSQNNIRNNCFSFFVRFSFCQSNIRQKVSFFFL